MQNKVLTDEALDRLLNEYMPKANILLDQLEEEREKDIIPHVFSESYKRKMKKIIKEYNKTPVQRKPISLRKFAAAILVLFILTNGILLVTAQAYRERFFEIINTVYKKFTSIVIEVEKPSNEGLSFTQPSYIPDGFEIISDIQTDITRKIDYMDNDKIIVFKQSIITSGETKIDTEDTSTKEIEINKYIIKYSFNKDIYNAYWNDNEFKYIINAEASFEEFVKIIEGIIKSKN
ncbi:DUF4367 domain-containing protein [Tissierella carlieri]|uniref:DUF4367 domain-containing protein n=1 Tax=Tissierella carlieri TaxID=689904 RepID=UPI001C101A85|nr:DUF4367 domain-containing protein [Tissierella carlieri]MBU5314472.1 DUF4367 domain-containing protein [Tissierella carlieri]